MRAERELERGELEVTYVARGALSSLVKTVPAEVLHWTSVLPPPSIFDSSFHLLRLTTAASTAPNNDFLDHTGFVEPLEPP